MTNNKTQEMLNAEAIETQEWRESMDYVLQHRVWSRAVRHLLEQLEMYAYENGVRLSFSANTLILTPFQQTNSSIPATARSSGALKA